MKQVQHNTNEKLVLRKSLHSMKKLQKLFQ